LYNVNAMKIKLMKIIIKKKCIFICVKTIINTQIVFSQHIIQVNCKDIKPILE